MNNYYKFVCAPAVAEVKSNIITERTAIHTLHLLPVTFIPINDPVLAAVVY
jgi:hypothetical protein